VRSFWLRRVSVRLQLSPGSVLVREWHGVGHQVTIIEKGVLYRGERYRSMSEVARLITGAGIVKLSRRARLEGSVSPASAMDLS
jgi:hypothetical protein